MKKPDAAAKPADENPARATAFSPLSQFQGPLGLIRRLMNPRAYREAKLEHTSSRGRAGTVMQAATAPSIDPLSQVALQDALRTQRPDATSSGSSSSYFLKDKNGKRVAVFKPMSGEAGGAANQRMQQAGRANVQWRSTINPGQGAGNEVLVHTVNQALGGHYGVPKTQLVELSHNQFGQRQLGSVQEAVSGKALLELRPQELAAIPREEFDKLNMNLLTGNTDAHLGNFLYDQQTRKLSLIDGGFHFPGANDHSGLAIQGWANLPQAQEEMSPAEYDRLKTMNVDEVMHKRKTLSEDDANKDPMLRLSADKMLGLKMRLELGKIAGEKQLTQKEWVHLLSSEYPALYQLFISRPNPGLSERSDWQTTDRQINWNAIKTELNAAADEVIGNRPPNMPLARYPRYD